MGQIGVSLPKEHTVFVFIYGVFPVIYNSNSSKGYWMKILFKNTFFLSEPSGKLYVTKSNEKEWTQDIKSMYERNSSSFFVLFFLVMIGSLVGC